MAHFKSEIIADRECFVYIPRNNSNEVSDLTKKPVIYIHGDDETRKLLDDSDYIAELNCMIILIVNENRLSELTPWAAKALHPKFDDFGGKASDYISWMERLKEEVDLRYNTVSSSDATGMLGYSLGGLCSIYALYQTNIFGVIGSVSGSFWYPNFIQFCSDEVIKNHKIQVYLSSGDSEGLGHKDIKKDAVLNTKQLYEVLQNQLGSDRVELHFDEGGHHNNKELRYEKALRWMNETLNRMN